ncbi:hypothetical protein [Agaribacterium haliotis]|uniref:hypothetical protein n=1 Tax=Agaribacterium haliotis TaxID=2013869 RepID=UPI000BB5955E|nr:hypothetical protein [Agaribacterium haliotis]
MKLLAVLSVLFAANSVLAGEVGTPNPSSEVKAEKVELALADKGAGTSWSVEPLKFQATAHQTAELNKRVDQMNAEISANLDALIAEKVEASLAN